MIAIVLPKADDKLLSALKLQKCKDFKVYVAEGELEEEPLLEMRRGSWSQVQEPLLCILTPGAVPPPDFTARIVRSIQRHPAFSVYHVNVEGVRPFPRKASARKLFKLAVLQGVAAPLSSFVFRTEVLREKAVFRADGTLDPLPTAFSCAREKPVRNVWRGTVKWEAPLPSKDPMAVERAVREKLDLLRWTEDFFGDDDYPLSVGDQQKLFARELVKLYPSYSEEDLKEMMGGFMVAKGPVRKVRAMRALKSALKERGAELQQG